jgi:hypothetical protein
MKEVWRPIPNYENLYEVSNIGRVRSVSRVVTRSRIHGKTHKCDIHEVHYKSRIIRPCRYSKKTGSPVYHLHKRYKPGYYGQTDTYHRIEDLIMLAFPELYEKED